MRLLSIGCWGKGWLWFRFWLYRIMFDVEAVFDCAALASEEAFAVDLGET